MRKKITRAAGLCASCAFILSALWGSGIVFSACKTKTNISKAEILGLDIYYLPESEIDFDAVTLFVTYDDGSTETLKNKEYDISDKDAAEGTEFIVSTSGLYLENAKEGDMKEGDYKITFSVPSQKYSGVSETVTVGKNYAKDLEAVDYEDPEFLSVYKFRAGESEKRPNDEDAFFEVPEEYFVGDDNGFEFKPEFYVYNPATKAYGKFSGYETEMTVTLRDEGTGLDVSELCSCDGFIVDFTEKAVGHKFTISLTSPAGMTPLYGGDFPDISMDVMVGDGWNVTTVEDLGRMALVSDTFNRQDFVNGDDEKSVEGGAPAKIYWDGASGHTAKYTSDIWREYLEALGFRDLSPVNGIYLHGDLAITESDLPEDFLVSEAEARHYGVNYDDMVGSIRDGVRIFEKNVEEDFTFSGNLFSIDCSSLKWSLTHLDSDFSLTYYGENATSYRESSVTVFSFQGLTSRYANVRATVTMENLSAVGNGIDVNDTEGRAAGSVRFVESRSSVTKVRNCRVREFLSGFSAKNSDDSYVNLDIDRTKVHDCYNFALIVTKSASNNVTNSEFLRFSCPAVTLMSDTSENELSPHSYSKAGLTVDENTRIESALNGTEAWWVANGASSVAGYVSYADSWVVGPCTNYTKTILNEDGKLNMLAVFQDGEYFGQGSTKLNTYFKQGDGVPYILNETVWDSSMGSRSEIASAEELAFFNAAATNYYVDSIAKDTLLPIPLTFMTNTGKLCAASTTLNSFLDPLSFQFESRAYGDQDRIVFDEDDGWLYMFYRMDSVGSDGVGLSIIIELYDA
ncbi:MAG: hypothetical protein LUD29_05320 [Clostridia bacterium]|nr:hypothetical protein [Clostridia bacterium]